MTDPYRAPASASGGPLPRPPLGWVALAYGILGSGISLGGAVLWGLRNLCTSTAEPVLFLSSEAFWAIAAACSTAVPVGVHAAVGAVLWRSVGGRALLGAASVFAAVVATYALASTIDAVGLGQGLLTGLLDGLLQGVVFGLLLCGIGLVPGLAIRPPRG